MRIIRFVVASLACAALAACNDGTSPTATGTVTVTVVNASGAGVPLVNLDLYKVLNGGGLLWRAGRTTSDGKFVFSNNIEPGDYYVHVSFVTNYRLVAGETNDKPVTVQSGADAAVTFHVEPSGPGI